MGGAKDQARDGRNLGPPTSAADRRRWPDPCKGWPSATASGGFGLDKRLASDILRRQGFDGQERASSRPPTRLPGPDTTQIFLLTKKTSYKAGGRNATVLRVQTLEDFGGVREIARNHVDQILGGLTPKEQALCADIFRYLVTGSGSKIAYPTDAMAKQVTSDRRQESSNADAATVSTEEVAAVLEELTGGEKRLLRPVKAGAAYELFHDVLGLPILDWRQKFIDNAAREEAEWERQAKEVAEQAARNAINLATKEANARATAEAQLREEAEHRALAETLARTSAEQKHSAEQQARDAAEKAASEAKARAVAETKRATAERQAREAAEKAAHEQKALAINLRNALIAVACVGVAALIGFGVSLYYSREASQQELRAEQLAEHAGRLANDVLTQLDRANRAIAATIDSDLVFEPGQTFAARTRNALWKLARADEAVRSDYIAILTNRPRELARATPGFPQISRSLGTRWPQPDEAERLFATAIDALTLGTSKSLIDAISALKSKLTEAQARQAVDSGLNRLVKTTDAGALRWLGQVIRTLPVKLTDAQAQPVLDFLLEQLGQNTDPQAFVWFAQAIQALPVKLTDAQARQALDPVLKRLGQTTDLVELSSLAEAIQILPVELTDAQAQAALAPLLAQLGQTTDPRTLQVARAIQVLALKLTDAQAQAAADLLLKQLGQTTDPSTLQALTQAILALATKLTDAQAQACADLLLKQLAQTTDSRILQAIQALATRLTDAQAQAALAPCLHSWDRRPIPEPSRRSPGRSRPWRPSSPTRRPKLPLTSCSNSWDRRPIPAPSRRSPRRSRRWRQNLPTRRPRLELISCSNSWHRQSIRGPSRRSPRRSRRWRQDLPTRRPRQPLPPCLHSWDRRPILEPSGRSPRRSRRCPGSSRTRRPKLALISCSNSWHRRPIRGPSRRSPRRSKRW